MFNSNNINTRSIKEESKVITEEFSLTLPISTTLGIMKPAAAARFILGPISLNLILIILDNIGKSEFIPRPNVVNIMNKGTFNVKKLKNPVIDTIIPEIINDLLGFPIMGSNAYPIKATLYESIVSVNYHALTGVASCFKAKACQR
ncbi:hypothetical protein [Acidianus brierleyi]|uniref:hypothetical protein n=1 Tax=Acidianus brierleyi TaxID=41673 RepID=UPI0013A53FC5|nr:hypothetical protein [Acidianus brierleyi]